ncbi:MAG: hypothetical protein A3G33_08140 [Omnitrophica bacterium RIFCSPLOWO2_12_FULL_44_17]|uniref:Uncharacterized protein n=1 Tax=Candidatus Danuiimicrobium aquiferis TaxID=1801832 RepID=A0A1G1KY62_9BACT|nr:MAG: hypothetical protein A3B72_05840 [Omnitrophica bacterium RIFCSPHIGHO2_02_FULL_45_28]OGW89754.1 MAG: hypothetical protein A3E74_06305 [Omnitrophica bacterium RIFCSPHIGHO2_12_FULL_44_12]OGW97772.1 MAG: hypothetical protein A3G33_08140 [Omnitrophica bacterium RIFCSPLOWO2_12_FULL_44_17]OGX04976.1 MAG: hypothetical protein A3J12_02065 [Omnitrophica bacterium RIFCSPLOWO2_02_FULL_44_11]
MNATHVIPQTRDKQLESFLLVVRENLQDYAFQEPLTPPEKFKAFLRSRIEVESNNRSNFLFLQEMRAALEAAGFRNEAQCVGFVLDGYLRGGFNGGVQHEGV